MSHLKTTLLVFTIVCGLFLTVFGSTINSSANASGRVETIAVTDADVCTDMGDDPYQRDTVTIQRKNGEVWQEADVCLSDGRLQEQRCTESEDYPGAKNFGATYYDCQHGCTDGACREIFPLPSPKITCDLLKENQQNFFRLCREDGYETVCFSNEGKYMGCGYRVRNDCTSNNNSAATNILCDAGDDHVPLPTPIPVPATGTVSPATTATQIGFRNATWACYDGVSSEQGGPTSCKSSETWQKYAAESCEKHCYSDGSKCGVNSFSVYNECRVSGLGGTDEEETEKPPSIIGVTWSSDWENATVMFSERTSKEYELLREVYRETNDRSANISMSVPVGSTSVKSDGHRSIFEKLGGNRFEVKFALCPHALPEHIDASCGAAYAMNVPYKDNEIGFRNATWACYDGASSKRGGPTSCKSSETWQKYAAESCEGHCYSDGRKCDVNSFNVYNECRLSSSDDGGSDFIVPPRKLPPNPTPASPIIIPTITVPEEPKIGDKHSSLLIIRDDDHVFPGAPSNPSVALIEYADLECPFCKSHHETMKRVQSELGGNAAWVFRHFPLSMHKNAFDAALVSECVAAKGGNDTFWEFIDGIFTQGATEEAMVNVAQSIGISQATLESCFGPGGKTEKKFRKSIQETMEGGKKLEVTGTPTTFVVNLQTWKSERLDGAVPYEEVFRAVKNVWDGSRPYPHPPVPDFSIPPLPNLPPAGYEDEVRVNYVVAENPFPDTDIASLDGIAAAELYRRAVIGGFPDGTFRGKQPVNRAEAAKFLLLARFGDIPETQNNRRFPDVLDGEWYTKYVVAAADRGIIAGHPSGFFKPADQVNRAEFLKMLSLTFDLPTGGKFRYTDVVYDAWYAPYAGIAERFDLFPGRHDLLLPGQPLTRGEVAVAIYQYLKNR